MIHPRAVVDPAAELASDVEVGPYAVIGPDVTIENGTWIGPHAVIQGPTRIGCNNQIFQFASIGDIPQDKKFHGERTWLEIGSGNTIREYVSINRGTEAGGGITRIGNDNWIMAYCHIAHDCQVGNATVFANNASLAGHVLVHDYSILSGFSLVHQFSRLGQHCFLAFGAHIDRDVPPYVMAAGQRATPRGINVNGLQRHGFAKETVQTLKRAYKTLYSSGLRLDNALAALDEIGREVPEVAAFSAFIRGSRRGIIR